MFTGLIEETGVIRSIVRAGDAARLEIAAPRMAPALQDGESVAVDGCCLTVERHGAESFTAFASPETLARTTLAQARAGMPVNLERALALGDRLGGHLVSGHVDGVGRIELVERAGGGSWEFRFALPEALAAELIPKGSIAIDGVSLTVAALAGALVSVAVIPETCARTTLGRKRAGAPVNVETDMIGKYVVKQLARMQLAGVSASQSAPPRGGELTAEKLIEAGF